MKEYVDSNETKEKLLSDIFSSTLNNFAVVSSEYGVIKEFDLKIKFKYDNYELE